jgi:hypothetical protein
MAMGLRQSEQAQPADRDFTHRVRMRVLVSVFVLVLVPVPDRLRLLLRFARTGEKLARLFVRRPPHIRR